MSGGEKREMPGIIGGVGPLASAYFADLLVRKTKADCDQEHIPFVLYNDTLIPDRTGFILGKTKENPLPEMKKALAVLSGAGCTFIAITCNTAHYFYTDLQEYSPVPVVNMIEEAVKTAVKRVPGAKKIGIMATEGTIESGIYEKYIKEAGLGYEVPCEENRRITTDIIYNQIKAGKPADMQAFNTVVNELLNKGCDAVILGCTELSVINSDNMLTEKYPYFTDAMEALAEKCITLCNKEINL